MRAVLLIAAILLPALVNAQTAKEPDVAPQQPPVVTSVVVPVVGSIVGANGVRWKTDVELHNDQRSDVTVALSLPTTPSQPAIITTIPANDTVRFTDVVGEAFGMELALSPLLVQTSGHRSVQIKATAYGMRGDFATPPQPIAINYGSSYFPTRVLPDLSFSNDYRTNIGLVNLGERTADFTLALQRVTGRNLAVVRITLPASALWHMAIQQVFPLITNGDHFSVVVETNVHQTYVYASVIENATSSARFIQPSIGTQSTVEITPP